MDHELVSFVLRFVREAGEDQQARWRGVIKHVQSNTETSFTQFSEAMAFIYEYVNDVVETSFDETRRLGESFDVKNPFMETARLWGNTMPRYTKMMMESMGETMGTVSGQSLMEPMEQAIEATRTAWGVPTRADQERMATSLEALTQQLAELTAKVAELENRFAETQERTKE